MVAIECMAVVSVSEINDVKILAAYLVEKRGKQGKDTALAAPIH